MTIKCTIICDPRYPWGLTLGLGRMAKAEHGAWKYVLRYLVQFPVRVYVSAFRGTPLFVQIMVVHFALVPLFINPRDGLLVSHGLMSADFARELHSNYGAFLSCIVAITLNAGPMFPEIFRAGIQSIDKGRILEASARWGCVVGKTMRQVILPQAFGGSCRRWGTMLIAIVKTLRWLRRLVLPIWPMPRVPFPAPMPPTGSPTEPFSGLLGPLPSCWRSWLTVWKEGLAK